MAGVQTVPSRRPPPLPCRGCLDSPFVTTLPGPLVFSSWLTEHLDDPGVVVVDVRWYLDGRSGEAAYDAGHIPGAVFIDVDQDLSGSAVAGPGRHPLPSPERFAEVMERCGIGDDTAVVAYDDAGGSIAARLWWMLKVTGHEAGVLDGGISAWTGELSLDLPPSSTGPVRFTARPWPTDSVVDVLAVDAARRTGDVVILDARSAERYRGEPNPIDQRLGHIPGAVSAPWSDNIDPETGRLRSTGDLRARFTRLGVRADRPAVCHCGSGITACHNLLALEVARLNGGRLYPGSWSDWAADPDRPAVTGPEPSGD